MSAKFIEKANEINAPEITEALDQIKQGVMIMSPASGTAKGLLYTADELDNAAWVDFSEIRYFFEPAPTHNPEVTQKIHRIDQADGDSRNYEQRFYLPFEKAVTKGISDNLHYYIHLNQRDRGWKVVEDPKAGTICGIAEPEGNPQHGTPSHREDWIYHLRLIVDLMVSLLPYQDLADIADSYFSIQPLSTSDLWSAQKTFFKKIRLHFYNGWNLWEQFSTYEALNTNNLSSYWEKKIADIWKGLKEMLLAEFGTGSEDIGDLQDEFTYKPPTPDPEFPFVVFPTGGINIGLRLVYRQEWRPLGIQRGEVVRTIPLGPKQIEKVSTKIVRRSKVTKTSESLKSTESTTETSDTTKDSSEIINEASSAMKWNVNAEVEGSFDIGIGSAGVNTSSGFSQESTDRSKETSTRLSETMRKIANKVRTDTKVVLSTESETTFEATSASEIQNPNDEIAITYVFSKLQRQYEILTKLAEVQNVVMVAEELPLPEKIDFDWVKRYDWIIAKVLLDDSFRDTLNSISQEVGQPDLWNLTADLKKARDDTIGHMGKFASTASVTAQDIDFAGESQKNFLGTAKEQLERLRENYLADLKKYRLLEHIRDNILHYCRAIWEREDPQQRMLRYRKQGTTVPLDWQFQTDILNDAMGIDEFVERFGNDSDDGVSGQFIADSQGRSIPIVNLLNPAGPIAFYGNYAVYYMRPEYASDEGLMALIDKFKLPYIYRDELMDPVEKKYIEECDSKSVSNATIDKCKMEMIKNINELQKKFNDVKDKPGELANFMADYATFKSHYDTYLLWKANQNQEDMIDHVPDLRLKYLQAKGKVDSGEYPNALNVFFGDHQTFKDFYPEYLFRMEMSRRFLVDTNCLMIDLLPGEGSALEPFKQMHRAIDVLKANEEREKMRLENVRRQKLITAERLGDPDIEKATVVTGSNMDLSDLVIGEPEGETAEKSETKKPLFSIGKWSLMNREESNHGMKTQ